MNSRIIDTGSECICGARETEGRHESPVAWAPDAQSMRVDVLSASQIGDGAEQVIELAAAAGAEVVGLSVVKAIAGTAAIVDRQYDIALGDEVLIKCVYPAIRTLGIEPQQHLSLRASVEEQNRRVRLGGGFAW